MPRGMLEPQRQQGSTGTQSQHEGPIAMKTGSLAPRLGSPTSAQPLQSLSHSPQRDIPVLPLQDPTDVQRDGVLLS